MSRLHDLIKNIRIHDKLNSEDIKAEGALSAAPALSPGAFFIAMLGIQKDIVRPERKDSEGG
jgi:hypothetical protein